ncbi:MAG: phosphoribosylglycinamide formyltransferase [Stygiobacter sp.]|nr:MAG: phosphoribosylglycinamide formyltransferase [Stygiobacter sp.]KAF0211864.1 MAG: phosphoribosylglycinamide [Ignavibacteria bacterium]
MFNVAVFVSGRGSNLRALYEKVSGESVKICAVVSDKKDCGAAEFAKENSIPVFFVSSKIADGFSSYKSVAEELKKMFVDLIVLAGFLKKIPDEFVDEFENKIINIHPALLPSYGGKGMYGLNVHKAVFEARDKISGATVHFVDKVYDNGKIIAQRSVNIEDVKSAEEIAARVLKIEHELLPDVVQKFSEGRIKIN